ncbi:MULTISPECIES: ABC transporter ATP-binding protein [unclassified Francisella]|uniref:ABC transporter ATP-binding protein n=1 Tax=unclassified Francisella TaxID=2610885 RepID=UPI002E3747C5|nr:MULTISPECIES: ABC transporter ATP-binding protein [unclassified Francisella]MED7820385.1 ABC transporter ATP-binding protein [Francisella sp. 19S2-4]MED7831220.1 ABC transporter ATP-binding protein [Francisella sp. 19S2-10]
MIELMNVTKFYNIKGKKHYILKDASYKFPSGKSIGLLGANGAGKSTLLRLLGGLELPNSGKIVSTSNISWPVGLTAGFQGSLTAKQNIKFVCQIHGMNIKETKRITDFVYDFAEIGDFFYMPVKTYSSGMRSRINFGLSMAFNFDYYLVDEVTAVGDAHFKAKALEEFDKKRKSACVIMVSHNMNDLKKYVDMGVFLKDGKISIYENIDDAIAVYEK